MEKEKEQKREKVLIEQWKEEEENTNKGIEGLSR